MIQSTDKSLVEAIATDGVAQLASSVSDMALNAAIDSGALDGVPIIGFLTGALRAGGEVREALFVRKVAKFLSQLNEASAEERERFVRGFKSEADKQKFGEAILLLLERSDDMQKPKIIGRIMTALVRGQLEEAKAFRLCAIVDRCYLRDLELLKNFSPGLQGANAIIAEALQAIGLLSTFGSDGGEISDPDLGGTLFKLNEYGALLLRYGLSDDG